MSQRASRFVFHTVLGAAFLAAVLFFAPARALADDGLLRGPPPFLKENAVTVQAGLARGFEGWIGGTKIVLGYGFKFRHPLWLNLEAGFHQPICQRALYALDACAEYRARAVEMMAGVRRRFALPWPVVPYVGASVGPVFVFPEAYKAAYGLALRGVAGARYFFYENLGVGAELAYSWGRTARNSLYPGPRGYGLLDLTVGGEMLF